jgi:branched-chain amino acid transport system substrate-binding protein
MRGRKLGLSLAVLEAALATALAVTLVGCSASTSGTGGTSGGTPAAQPIKIGAIVSLTGTYAGLGAPEKNTLEMEVKRINDAGGINGRQVELVIEDDGTDQAKAAAAAAKLIDQDKVVALIGATGTGQTMAIRGEVDKAAIPDVSMAGGSAVTAAPLDPLVFQTPWSNKLVIPFELKDMKSVGRSKIGVISDTGGFGKDGLAVLQVEAPKAGITIVSNQTFNVGDTDFSAQLTKIKNSGADTLMVITSGKEAAAIVQSANQLKLQDKMLFYGTHGNARMEFVKGAGAAAEGFRFAAGKILIPSSWGTGTPEFTATTDFIDRYSAAYAGEKPSTFAGHAYDAINIIAEAAKRVTGDLTAAALRDEIEKTTGFVGMSGTFNYTPTDHNGLKETDLNMYEVKNGTWAIATKP